MVKGFVWLTLAYGLSQFYRACLAVFAPVLDAEIGLGADQVSTAVGLWFLAFAAMQIPVGWLLDHKSPRLTASILLLLGGGGGAVVFGLAQGALSIYMAMILIGIGCSPVLMTSFYIFARLAPHEKFGTLAGLVLGIGSLGNVLASAPLSIALEAIGWRATMFVLAGVTALVALALSRLVGDPPRVSRDRTQPKRKLSDLLRIYPLYPILIIAMVAYAPGAGLRGSWIGGYLSDVFGLGSIQIGNATIYMAIAMILGSFAFGPADRVIKSRKVIIGGSGIVTIVALLTLWRSGGQWPVVPTVALFMVVGFFTASYPQIMNHGRTLLPEDLVGRGVTLINLFSIGGVGVFQIITARLFAHTQVSAPTVVTPYGSVFVFFAVMLAIGLVIYVVDLKRFTGGAHD
ncbi:MFS transporter [Celeribacter marinus]|uniref:MFS transporter n=2 Tax=Celeribacter marinus TaxID=1397108 RepID=UPI003175457D